MFMVAPESDLDLGNLDTWVNVHKLISKPFLVGTLLGKAALNFEEFSDEEVKIHGKSVR